MKLEANIAGVPCVYDTETAKPESRLFLEEYGWRQYVQDGAAVSKLFTSGDRKGEAKTDAEIAEEKALGVAARLVNIELGEFVRRGTVERLTPEEAERIAVCEAAIRDAASAAKVKLPTKKADADWWKDRVAKYYAKYQADVDKEVARRMRQAAKAVDMTGILD